MASDDDPLDRIETEVTRLAQSHQWEQDNRRGLLWVHALIGLTAGVQMFLWGSATTIENSVGVWSRVAMACLGIVGGLFLISGLRKRPRSVSLEAIGLVIVGVWDGAMMVGLAIARVKQHDFHIIALNTPLSQGYVVAYPIAVYAGLLALICIHLSTLVKMLRANP